MSPVHVVVIPRIQFRPTDFYDTMCTFPFAVETTIGNYRFFWSSRRTSLLHTDTRISYLKLEEGKGRSLLPILNRILHAAARQLYKMLEKHDQRKVDEQRRKTSAIRKRCIPRMRRGRSSPLMRLSLNEPEEMPAGRPQSHSKQHSKNCMEGQYVDSLSQTLYVCDVCIVRAYY